MLAVNFQPIVLPTLRAPFFLRKVPWVRGILHWKDEGAGGYRSSTLWPIAVAGLIVRNVIHCTQAKSRNYDSPSSARAVPRHDPFRAGYAHSLLHAPLGSGHFPQARWN